MSRPVEVGKDPWISGAKMGRREDTFVAEQVQEAPHQVGGEGKELRRDAPFRLRMDHLASSWNLTQVIISGLALIHSQR